MKRKTKKNNRLSSKYNKSKKNKKEIKYYNSNCSPNPNNKDYTCYSDNSLHKMKEYWNARHPRNKIISNNSKEIWNELSCSKGTKESIWKYLHTLMFLTCNDKLLLSNSDILSNLV